MDYLGEEEEYDILNELIDDPRKRHRRSTHMPINETKLNYRRKQIAIGKNTPEYRAYIEAVPIQQRDQFCPSTPNIHLDVSKRSFDGILKTWRRNLHKWASVNAPEIEKRYKIKTENGMDLLDNELEQDSI